jgi:hypothetical protein
MHTQKPSTATQMRPGGEFVMAYNQDRAIGCRIGYNAVVKAVRYIEEHDYIDPKASAHLRGVLKVIYGKKLYNYYRSRRPKKLRLVRYRR